MATRAQDAQDRRDPDQLALIGEPRASETPKGKEFLAIAALNGFAAAMKWWIDTQHERENK